MSYDLVSNYGRKKLDFYASPLCTVKCLTNEFEKLYSKQKSDIIVWDNCYGTGRIGDAIEDLGYDVVNSDIDEYEGIRRLDQKVDFLLATEPPNFNKYKNNKTKLIIATNPPYGRGLPDFIRYTDKILTDILNDKSNTIDDVEFWYLLRHTFDTGSTRMDVQDMIYEKHVMCWRPVWEEDSDGGGKHNSAWYRFKSMYNTNYAKTFYHKKP